MCGTYYISTTMKSTHYTSIASEYSVFKKQSNKLAEREGFEPPVVLPTSVFKTDLISQTLAPLQWLWTTTSQFRCKILSHLIASLICPFQEIAESRIVQKLWGALNRSATRPLIPSQGQMGFEPTRTYFSPTPLERKKGLEPSTSTLAR